MARGIWAPPPASIVIDPPVAAGIPLALVTWVPQESLALLCPVQHLVPQPPGLPHFLPSRPTWAPSLCEAAPPSGWGLISHQSYMSPLDQETQIKDTSVLSFLSGPGTSGRCLPQRYEQGHSQLPPNLSGA